MGKDDHTSRTKRSYRQAQRQFEFPELASKKLIRSFIMQKNAELNFVRVTGQSGMGCMWR